MDAADLLRSRVGVEMTTTAGRATRSFRWMKPPSLLQRNVRPAANTSPSRDVEDALSRLLHEGTVTITPTDVGYRSAFTSFSDTMVGQRRGILRGSSTSAVNGGPAALDVRQAI
jgi:hypothetical protein